MCDECYTVNAKQRLQLVWQEQFLYVLFYYVVFRSCAQTQLKLFRHHFLQVAAEMVVVEEAIHHQGGSAEEVVVH